jgi:signal transduction histidine kinase
MIKELIMITQYNLGIEKPRFETVNFDEWLFNIVSSSSADAKAKNISLEYEKFPYPIIVTFDTNGLEKVVTNVLNNALRYTTEFGVVKVAVLKNSNSFGFSISDSGIGIPDEDLQKIFDEFYRSKNAREAVQIGTGLGLNLVKEIVEQLGGNIEVESEIGKGSTFKITIPLQTCIEELIDESGNLFLSEVVEE